MNSKIKTMKDLIILEQVLTLAKINIRSSTNEKERHNGLYATIMVAEEIKGFPQNILKELEDICFYGEKQSNENLLELIDQILEDNTPSEADLKKNTILEDIMTGKARLVEEDGVLQSKLNWGDDPFTEEEDYYDEYEEDDDCDDSEDDENYDKDYTDDFDDDLLNDD
jgi:hypothetical protein